MEQFIVHRNRLAVQSLLDENSFTPVPSRVRRLWGFKRLFYDLQNE